MRFKWGGLLAIVAMVPLVLAFVPSAFAYSPDPVEACIRSHYAECGYKPKFLLGKSNPYNACMILYVNKCFCDLRQLNCDKPQP